MRRVVLLAGALGLAFASLDAQTTFTRSVRDGVFTPVQAARGQVAYGAYCASCHMPDL